MSTEMTIIPRAPVTLAGGSNPDRIAGLVRLLVDTQGLQPAAAMSRLAVAECAGLTLGEALTQVHDIQGRPTISATAQLSLARRAGVRSRWLTEASDTETAALRLVVPGDPDPIVTVYRRADAEAAGHMTGRNRATWAQHGAAMLRARCITAAIRMHCPEVLGGAVYDPVELDQPQVEYIDATPTAPRSEPAPTAPAAPPTPPAWDPLRALAALESAGITRAMLEAEHALGAPAEGWPEEQRGVLAGLLRRRRQRAGEPAAVVESGSAPGTYWLVMREAGDVLVCDCQAARHGRACRHVDVVAP